MNMYERLPIGTTVKIVYMYWGENCGNKPPEDFRIYGDELLNKVGKIVDHEDDFYTPPNVVEIDGQCYFFNKSNLEIINTKICTCGAKFTSRKDYHTTWC